MVSLTIDQKEIIYHLRERNGTLDEAQGVILLLMNDTAQKEMVTYLRLNPKATPMEIVEAAIDIRDKIKHRSHE